MRNPKIGRQLNRKRVRGKPQTEDLRSPPEKQPEYGDLKDPPSHLPGEGKKLWRRIIKELHRLGLVTSIDWELFAAMCQAYAEYREATDRVNKMTAKQKIVEIPGIAPHPHPWIKLQVEREKRYHTLACEFGCSPAARSRIKNKPQKKTPGIDKLNALRSGRNGKTGQDD